MPDAVPIFNKLVPVDVTSRLNQVKPSNEGPQNLDFPDFENNRFPFNIIDPVPAQNPLSGPLPLHCMVNVNIQFGLPTNLVPPSSIDVAFGQIGPPKIDITRASDIDV